MAHKRRDCCEIVREGEAPKGGEKGASGDGAKRRAAMRLGKASGRAAGDGSGATEQLQREDRVFLRLHRQARSERQRAEAAGIVTRRAKTAKRASWSRAGRSRVRRNRARRPVRRTGRAPGPSEQRIGRWSAVIGDDGRWPTSDRVRGMPNRDCHR